MPSEENVFSGVLVWMVIGFYLKKLFFRGGSLWKLRQYGSDIQCTQCFPVGIHVVA